MNEQEEIEVFWIIISSHDNIWIENGWEDFEKHETYISHSMYNLFKVDVNFNNLYQSMRNYYLLCNKFVVISRDGRIKFRLKFCFVLFMIIIGSFSGSSYN